MRTRAAARSISSFIVWLCIAGSCISQTRNWPAYNGGTNGDHYSPLRQINRGTVQRLQQVWRYDTGEKGGIQTNPLIVGGALYAYTPSQKVIALDAATGKLRWKFDSGIHGTQPARGLAYWSNGRQSRLFAGVMNFLYSLDPATGKPDPQFGEGGRIDLRRGLREPYEGQSIALTSPGVIYKDLIIVGGREPETHPAPPGDLRAFDIHTGKLRWVFHTIPHSGESGSETWPRDAWKKAGAANNWAGMTLDSNRGILYVPTGSAVMDFYGGDRIGNNLYADSLLALDAGTGKLLWYFQGVHHDVWDRDFPSPPALFKLQRDGQSIDALAQTSKQGYVYLFDRVTGEPLFPIHEHRYPASTVPGELTSPTQPLPDWPKPFARQQLTENMLTTRTQAAHQWAVKTFRTMRSEGQFLPFSLDRQTIVFPGFDGGAEWGGPAIDPATDVLFVNANEMAWTGGLTPVTPQGSLGEHIYRAQCAVCHGIDRSGSPPAFPSLLDVTKRLGEAKIAQTVKQGTGRMPSFPNLDETQLRELLTFLRTGSSVRPGKEMVPVPAQLTSTALDRQGEKIYASHCAICHGDRMEGIPPSFPMLIGLGNRMTASQAAALIHTGKGRMPAMPGLQKDELASLLRYLGLDSHPQATPTHKSAPPEYEFTGYRKFLDPDGYPAVAPPWGTLSAIDLKTGKYLWKIPLGEYPDLVRQGMTHTGSENYGGPIVTAGGVLFIGATVYDRRFRAFDTRNGRILWQTELPFAGTATPATYMIDGKQYVVIAASGGRDPRSPVGGAYIAFALK